MTSTQPRTDQTSLDTHPGVVGAAQTPSDDQCGPGTQGVGVVAGPTLLADHEHSGTQEVPVGEAPTPESTMNRPEPLVIASTQAPRASQTKPAAQSTRASSGTPTSPVTKASPAPTSVASPGISSSDNGHSTHGAHTATAVVAPSSAPDQRHAEAHLDSVGDGPTSPAAISSPTPIEQAPLVDKPLAVIAELLNDLEDLRKANVNRLEVMTRVGKDKDDEERGWALPEDHPAVISVRTMVEELGKVEAKAQGNLEKTLKNSPLGPWVVAQRGLGLKTIARLLASIGDPYWNDLHGRPRTVSELWAYTGYRPGLKRIKGEKVNWSPTAKMRLHNIIEPIKKLIKAPCYSEKDEKGAYIRAIHVEGGCTCSPYRVMWDKARDKYAGTLHPEDCVRCGPSGHPALAGSPRSAAHQAALADRLVKKEILKDLWREAKRLHELSGDHVRLDTHDDHVARGLPTE